MKNYLALIIVCVISIGCAPTGKKELQHTIQPTLSPTPKFILMPSEVVTVTASPQPTVTVQPTQISGKTISTPSKKDSAEITLDLLQTNGDCELPCFWGMVPNQTHWNDAEIFLRSFSYISLSTSPKWAVYFVRSPISTQFSELGEVRLTFATQNNIVKEIEVEAFDVISYHLHSLLEKYGVPSNILISTYSSDYGMPKNQVPLSVNLYYPDKGINALYGTTATVNGSQIYGCLEDSPILFLWSPVELTHSIDYIIGWDKSHIPYLDVEQAIGLNVQEFYEKYVDPSTRCLQTPTNLWQSQ